MANDSIRSNGPARGIQRSGANAEAPGFDIKMIVEGLKNGDPNPAAVNALQKFLNSKGASLATDGKFGPKTEAALRSFQEASGCKSTGVVDANTLNAINGRPVTKEPVADANQPQRQAASQTDVENSRTKMKTREELARARVEGAAKANKAGEDFAVLSDGDVSAATQQLDTLKGTIDNQKRQVGEARTTLGNEIKALEAKPQRQPAEDVLLEGKKQQDEVLSQLEKHLDLKKQGLQAAQDAASDGILTSGEQEGLTQFADIVGKKDQIIGAKAQAADRLVKMAEDAGARVPEQQASAKASAGANANAAAGSTASSQASSSTAPDANAVKSELKDVRGRINQQRADLDILKSAPPKDPQERARFNAEVGLKDQELKLLQKRAADLGKAEEALQKGPLSAEDAKALSTSKEQLETQTKALQGAKKAYDQVGAIRDKMVKEGGSVEGFVAQKKEAFADASAALDRAKNRGDENAIRAAFTKAEAAKAEYAVARRGAALVDETHKALTDGEVQESEQKLLGTVQTAMEDAKTRASTMQQRLPELEDKKGFASDLRDRVWSWFSSAADTSKVSDDYGRGIMV